jgi:alpha-beta hydrolase superfamily lysophospholipase
MTRRQLLAGIGVTGVVVVAGAGVEIELGNEGEHKSASTTPTPLRGANASLPPASSRHSGGRVDSGMLDSRHMGRSLGWTISTPHQPVQAVIFCLHGYRNDHRFAFDEIHLPDLVESARAPLAVAAVDGGADSYWHPRADGTDALAMLLEEFIPFVEDRTQTSRRALLGWSMGGYGSLLAAETAPGRFFAVSVASPALWTSPGLTAPGAFDDAADYHRFDVFGREQLLAPLTVRVDCGMSDPFYQATRHFVAGLPLGHQGSFGLGSHTPAYWRSVAPAQVATIARALAP